MRVKLTPSEYFDILDNLEWVEPFATPPNLATKIEKRCGEGAKCVSIAVTKDEAAWIKGFLGPYAGIWS